MWWKVGRVVHRPLSLVEKVHWIMSETLAGHWVTCEVYKSIIKLRK